MGCREDYQDVETDELESQVQERLDFLYLIGQVAAMVTQELVQDLAENSAEGFPEKTGRLLCGLHGFSFYDTEEQAGGREVRVWFQPESTKSGFDFADLKISDDNLVLAFLYQGSEPTLPGVEAHFEPSITYVNVFEEGASGDDDWEMALGRFLTKPEDLIKETLAERQERLRVLAKRLSLEEQASRLRL